MSACIPAQYVPVKRGQKRGYLYYGGQSGEVTSWCKVIGVDAEWVTYRWYPYRGLFAFFASAVESCHIDTFTTYYPKTLAGSK